MFDETHLSKYSINGKMWLFFNNMTASLIMFSRELKNFLGREITEVELFPG